MKFKDLTLTARSKPATVIIEAWARTSVQALDRIMRIGSAQVEVVLWPREGVLRPHIEGAAPRTVVVAYWRDGQIVVGTLLGVTIPVARIPKEET